MRRTGGTGTIRGLGELDGVEFIEAPLGGRRVREGEQYLIAGTLCDDGLFYAQDFAYFKVDADGGIHYNGTAGDHIVPHLEGATTLSAFREMRQRLRTQDQVP